MGIREPHRMLEQCLYIWKTKIQYFISEIEIILSCSLGPTKVKFGHNNPLSLSRIYFQEAIKNEHLDGGIS